MTSNVVILLLMNVFLETSNQEIRLVGGNNHLEGRVEVNVNGKWGTICDDFWDLRDATVACRQLGFKNATLAAQQAQFGAGQGPILLDNVGCEKDELSLLECRHITGHDCQHIEDAGVRCQPYDTEDMTIPQDIRLSGGNHTAGRIEVYVDEEWGTVCDDQWDIKDGLVVCRQLGFKGALSVTRLYLHKDGEGPIHFDEIACHGNETKLWDCRHTRHHDCRHREDAFVSCEPYSNGEIRIAGNNESAGTVEMYLNDGWRLICSNGWDLKKSTMVCRQLGFLDALFVNEYFLITKKQQTFGLVEISCEGYESTLTNCDHELNNRCVTKARVNCLQHYAIRLIGGSNRLEGRVEVYMNDQWGTICDDLWDLNDATVVCHQLGFKDASLAVGQARYGAGLGPIHLDDVRCTKEETFITECPHVINTDCQNTKDAGVRCIPYEFRDVRISDGNHTAGRIQIYYDDEWRAVCDDQHWDLYDAVVICRQLGFGDVFHTLGIMSYKAQKSHNPSVTVSCHGNETSLEECLDMTESNCETNDAGVSCYGLPHENGDIRLAHGNKITGRIEIYLDNAWSGICFSGWDLSDAMVACHQLGLKSAMLATSYESSEEGQETLTLTDFECFGNETSLMGCSRGPNHDCVHKFYARVVCNAHEPGDLRLVNGNHSAGRVEIFYDGQWGTVCDDDWDINDARVVCHQLGFKTAFRALTRSAFGLGQGPIHFDDVMCRGNERVLTECPKSETPNCGHQEDAAVSCQPFDELLTGPKITVLANFM